MEETFKDWKKKILEDGDCVMVIDGKERVGMSCMGISIGDYIKQK